MIKLKEKGQKCIDHDGHFGLSVKCLRYKMSKDKHMDLYYNDYPKFYV